MAEMTPFKYGGFWDVPRCIVLRHRKRWLLLHSPFDEEMDEYPDFYSAYALPESVADSIEEGSWDFMNVTPMTCIGQIPIEEVFFDPSKRKALDASCLDTLVDAL
jgi:hypothetical protein